MKHVRKNQNWGDSFFRGNEILSIAAVEGDEISNLV
jgi:hypothetical protein